MINSKTAKSFFGDELAAAGSFFCKIKAGTQWHT